MVAGFVPLLLRRGRSDVLLPMCPSFRLLQTLTRVEHEGDISEIDALLSCPLWMPDVATLDAFTAFPAATRDTLCHCLFFAINWLRETTNAFATTGDAELQGYVLGRIEHMQSLEKLVAAFLEHHHMQPYVAHAADEGIAAPLKRRAAAGGGGQLRSSTGSNAQQAHEATLQDDSQEPGSAAPATNTASLRTQTAAADGCGALLDQQRFRPYLRELDLAVFNVCVCVCVCVRARVRACLDEYSSIHPPVACSIVCHA